MVWHGTTILSVRSSGKVVIAGDGQVTAGQTVMKPNARKVRPLGDGSVIAGFGIGVHLEVLEIARYYFPKPC